MPLTVRKGRTHIHKRFSSSATSFLFNRKASSSCATGLFLSHITDHHLWWIRSLIFALSQCWHWWVWRSHGCCSVNSNWKVYHHNNRKGYHVDQSFTLHIWLLRRALQWYIYRYSLLKDNVLCSALVYRPCHKSYLVNMAGTSYRIKETKKAHPTNA